MAESAVKSAANWLGKLLVEEGKYLWGVEDKLAELRNELIWMQCFLRDAESLQYDDEIVPLWVLQIKEYVYHAEDIVDKFVIQVASRRRQTDWTDKLRRWSCIGKELLTLHQVAADIDSLRLKISMLTPKLKTYGLNPTYGMKTYRTQEALSEQTQHRLIVEKKNIVGLEEDTKELVDALREPNATRKIVAIYGMGGLGKTTLATKVYYQDEIRKHFTGGCAWAYISKQFQFQNVLQKILADLTSKSTDMFAGKRDNDLIDELHDILLRNKCLVVLDDVWQSLVWDRLKSAFPLDRKEFVGRILLTTRKKDVAEYADRRALSKPVRLDDVAGWDLLKLTLGWVDTNVSGFGNVERDVAHNKDQSKVCESSGEKTNEIEMEHEINRKKMQVQTNVAENHRLPSLLTEIFGNDGTEVFKLGMEMVKHCNGIPLAIVVLGGILRKKETLQEWSLVRKNVTSYLRRGNDHGRSYMEVLVLSYNDLPYHLKPCFLHIGSFPEDYEIQTEKLYRMWVAEGLITWPHDRVSSTESLEDIANDYLSELALAGMVQVMNKGSDGRIKSIRIHDLMRDMCLQKGAMENFVSIIDHRPYPAEPHSISSSSHHARLLRMAVYLVQGVKDYFPPYLTTKAHKYLRSLLLFSGQEIQERQFQLWMRRIFNDFPWLRVLDIEGLHLEGKLTTDVQNVKHLRYLSLKGTNLSELPSSICNLRFLQTLDLRVSVVGSLVKSVKIPNTLWKLEGLRHLFLPKKSYEIKSSKCLWLHTLSSLETLKNLEVDKCRIEDLQYLRKLKKITIKDAVFKGESLKMIVESPAFTSGNLRCCSLGVKGNAIDNKPSVLSSFSCLRHLKLMDKILHWEEYVLPQSLEVVHMEGCEIKSNPMRILGALGHLRDLLLGHNSYHGKEMVCEPESFPQLTTLNLRGLVNLEDWSLKQSSMSRLRRLIILDCVNLKKIPEDLPPLVQITCSPCIDGIEKLGTCSYYRATSSVVDYEQVFVGRKYDIEWLVKDLVDDPSKKLVLFGASGLGKVATVKMLYRQPKIRERFNAIALDHCPNIPNPPKHFIKGILRQLDPAKSSDTQISDCKSTLQDILQQKKCLVILTDLAVPPEALDEIFGSSMENGSKLLLTTHKQTNMLIHRLTPQSDDERFALFQSILGNSLTGTGGEEKLKLGKSMLRYTDGQLLSIIMLAGLLGMKKSLEEWQNIQNDVDSRKEKVQGPQLIYELSYDDLPLQLKSCFLYMGIFPKGTEISARKLYSIWIGAGLVRIKDEEDSSKKKKDERRFEEVKLFENVAESYLKELVLRGMVQVRKRDPGQRICTCQLHIALQSLCIEKAKEEGFFTVIGHSQSSASTSESNERFVSEHGMQRGPADRIMTILCLGKARDHDQQHATPLASAINESINTKHLAFHMNQGDGRELVKKLEYSTDQLKSLLFFPLDDDGECEWERFIEICNRFRSLQVLDLEGMRMMKGAMPVEVGNLILLRHLSLKGTGVSELPSKIQQLSSLQILDLRVTEPLYIPDVLSSFKHLRHLLLPDSVSPRSPKLSLNELNHLHTLTNLHTLKVDLDCLSKLKALRKMSVKTIHPGTDLFEKLKPISSHIDLSIDSEILNGNVTILSTFPDLHRVTVKGRISAPLDVGSFPEGLKELKLKHSELGEECIRVLEELPELTYLFFDHDSFIGKKMTFRRGGFSRLTHLAFRLLSNLEELDMTAADHLRFLHSFQVTDCWRARRTERKFSAAKTVITESKRE
ncbi:hypothetical protein V2J09_001820 [Rumex salicifolius]